jgi:hypothetical protein
MILRALFVTVLPALSLGGCATVRMHGQEELVALSRRCGVALGNVVQFEEEPRLLFLLPVERAGQFVCVSRWARRHRLRLVYMEEAEP